MRIKLIIFVSIMLASSYAWAENQRIERVGKAWVQVGEGTNYLDMTFLLKRIAGQADQYFDTIYGQHRNINVLDRANRRGGYSIIEMKRNEQSVSIETLEQLTKEIVKNVNTYFPESEGRISLLSSYQDMWNVIRCEFKDGKVLNIEFMPDKNEVQKMMLSAHGMKIPLNEEKSNALLGKHSKLVDWAEQEAVKICPKSILCQNSQEDMVFYPKETELFKEYGLTEQEGRNMLFLIGESKLTEANKPQS